MTRSSSGCVELFEILPFDSIHTPEREAWSQSVPPRKNRGIELWRPAASQYCARVRSNSHVTRLGKGCRRYIQKFARRCPDRFGAGLQPPDKVKHSLVDLLGSLLLGPMTATWQQESSPKLRYKLRQVGDDYAADDLTHGHVMA